MAQNKTEDFKKDEIKLAEFAKALAHPARIAIIKTLMEKNCVCGEIVNELPLSQSTVSQHLKELKEAGLIKGEVDGPRVCYCINQDNWKYISDFFKQFLDSVCDCASCNC